MNSESNSIEVLETSLPTNQIFHLCSEQTTFCADALLNRCGDSGTDDV